MPTGTILAALDVTSLYINIPHNEGIKACRTALETREAQQPPTNDLTKLIEMILLRNNFIFGEDHCLQLHGMALGTKMDPLYANLFINVGRLETHLLKVAAKKPTVWWRYINDVFIIWPHGEGCLN